MSKFPFKTLGFLSPFFTEEYLQKMFHRFIHKVIKINMCNVKEGNGSLAWVVGEQSKER